MAKAKIRVLLGNGCHFGRGWSLVRRCLVLGKELCPQVVSDTLALGDWL